MRHDFCDALKNSISTYKEPMSSIKTTYIHSDVEPFYVGSTSAAVSGSGEILATPLDEDIVLTNLFTNEVLHTLEGDGELVTNLAITPDGSIIAVVSQSQQLRVFEVSSGELLKSFKLLSPVYISAADNTSSLFAFGGSDGVITVWDIEGGYVTHSLKGHGTTISSLAFHGELNSAEWKLASGDTTGIVKIWDLVKRKCVHTINEHGTAVRGVGFDSTGNHFITAGRDGLAIIYDVNKRFRVLNAFPVKEQVESAGFIGTDHFYTAGSTNTLRVWDINNGSLVAKSPIPFETTEELLVIDVKLLTSGEFILVVSDQTLVFLESKVEFFAYAGDELVLPILKRIAGNHGIIADLKYVGPDFDLLALATNSPSLRIVDPKKPLEVQLCEGHTDLLNALDVSTDGKWIATASKDNEARLWKWDDETSEFLPYARFQGHAGSISALSLSKTSKAIPDFLITGSADLTVKKWKIPTVVDTIVKTSIYTRRAHDKDINSIDVSPNDEFFATASYDKLAKIWDLETGETVGILKGHKRGLWDINFYKFDKLIVTGSGDKTIKVWSLHDFTCVKTFEGHTNAIQRVKFFNKWLPQLISTGADGLIKLWDYKQGEVVKTFDNHDNRIWSIDIKDDDGSKFITADADGKLVEWTDNTQEEIKDKELQSKLKVEQEQTLKNYIHSKDWANAFLLALTLDHSMRLYNVVKSCIEAHDDTDSTLGSFTLEKIIVSLDDEQFIKLFKKIRDWNINFKFFEISQKLLSVILAGVGMQRLSDIPGVMKIIDAIIPYNERHYLRIDDLVEQSYILDYAVGEMNKLIV